MAVRPATSADVVVLAHELAKLPLFQRYQLGEGTLRTRWEEALEAEEPMLVWAEEGKAPLGICLYLERGTFGAGAYLRTLALVPSAQRQGLGAKLLTAFEEAASTAPGGYFILTSDFNVPARTFYERHGYRVVGHLSDFSAAGVTELVLWKRPRPGAPQ